MGAGTPICGEKILDYFPFCVGKFVSLGHGRVLPKKRELYGKSGLQRLRWGFKGFHTEPSKLAAAYPQVLVSQSNQKILESADTVVLAIRPQAAESVIRGLAFRTGQKIISVITATPRALLAQWINAQVDIVQAIPLPFVAQRTGVTAIYPPSLEVAALFNQLGCGVDCQTKEEYDLLAAASALMSTYYGVLHSAVSWLAAHGLPSDKARDYLSHLYVALSDAAVSRKPAPFSELSIASTSGGLNEQVLRGLNHHDGERALHLALDKVFERIRRISD